MADLGTKIRSGDYLLIERWNRFSRQELLKSLGLFITIVDKHGVIIVTTSPRDQEVYDQKSGASKLNRLLIALEEAQKKVDEISADLKDVWAAKWKIARSGAYKPTGSHVSWVRPKAWVEITNEITNKTRKYPIEFELIPECVRTLVKIYTLCKEKRWGNRLIADELNRINEAYFSHNQAGKYHPPFGRANHKLRKKRGQNDPQIWLPSMVDNLLTSKAVLGIFQPHYIPTFEPTYERKEHGQEIPDYYPAVPGISKRSCGMRSRLRPSELLGGLDPLKLADHDLEAMLGRNVEKFTCLAASGWLVIRRNDAEERPGFLAENENTPTPHSTADIGQ